MASVCRCGASVACELCESCAAHCVLNGLDVNEADAQAHESAHAEEEGTLAPVATTAPGSAP